VDFVRYSGSPPSGCPPRVWEELCDTGLPARVITIFVAQPQPSPAARQLGDREVDGIVLGHSREEDELFLDFTAAQVWLLHTWGSGQPILVNRTLPAFVASLLAADERYPFPATEDSDQELRELLAGIDEAALDDPDGFWRAFLDDVAVGDYSGPASP